MWEWGRKLWVRLGIRRQLTVFAAIAVSLPLALGVFVFGNLLTRSLTNSLVDSTGQVAERVSDYVADHGLLMMPGELDVAQEYRVQVVDANGDVLWTSAPRYNEAFSDLHPASGQQMHAGGLMYWLPREPAELDLVVAEGVANSELVVQVATSQRDQQSAVNLTVALLASAIPLLTLATSVVAWWLVGRALRPVERMTGRLARINSPIGEERVPVPSADDSLRTLGETMNDMLDRLQLAQRSQRSFVSDASHELRSPVATLSGAIEIASMADDLATWREMSGLMGSEVKRLDELVQGLLALSRADDSGLTLTKQDVDLDDLAEAEVARLRSSATREVKADVHPARLVADPSLLRQILVNLGDNAMRHADSMVRVTVRQEPDGGAVLRVDDDGAGIAEEDRSRVFDRFVRLQESRTRDEGGSGLGLAIVAQIVRAHRGRIEIVDSDLGGAGFVVRLPAGG